VEQQRVGKGKRPRQDNHFAPPSAVSGVPKMVGTSMGKLTGRIDINLTLYQYCNVCWYYHINKFLTDDHKNLQIVNDLAILKLVSRTCSFIPTPSGNQLVFNVHRLLNIFCIRVYNLISKSIGLILICQGAEEAQDKYPLNCLCEPK
jgi:hypothetical protein